MKRTINEYSDHMNKITPSESFISDTEALMRKIRDEQAGSKIQTENAENIILSGKSSRNIKIKRVTMAISAAAAVIVCFVSVNLFSRTNISVDTNAQPDETEPSVISDMNEISAAEGTDSTEIITADVVNDDIISETAAETEIQEISETSAAEEKRPETSVRDLRDDERNTVPSDTEKKRTESTVSEKQSQRANIITEAVSMTSYAYSGNGNTVTESVSAGAVTNNIYIFDETSGSIYGYYDDSYGYEDDEADEGIYEDYSENTGVPVYVPPFGTDEETADVGEIHGGEYYIAAQNHTADFYTLNFSSTAAGTVEADSVYVPDSIEGLDYGEFYIVVNSGYDSYDEETGAFSVPEDKTVNADNTESISAVMDSIQAVISGKAPMYYGEEKFVADYRYMISVYSSDENEDNALLFEIMFDGSTMIINRYDNGTVSSEEYVISDEEYKNTDKTVGMI